MREGRDKSLPEKVTVVLYGSLKISWFTMVVYEDWKLTVEEYKENQTSGGELV